MKHSEMALDKYYYMEESSFWMIGKITKTGLISNQNGQNSTLATIISLAKEYVEGCQWSSIKREIREATQEEIEWLDLCIKAKSYINKPEKKIPQIIENYQLY